MKLLLTALCFILFSQTAHAQTAQTKFAMVGIGAITCHQWNTTEKDDFIRGTVVQWVYGYFSALNKVRAKKGHRQYNLRRLTTNNVLEAIEEFCPYYPDYLLSYAADSMIGNKIRVEERR
jgi:hypothetical protein